MQIYMVGGAVRDKLLKRTVKDRDFVVTGSTIEEMEALGYKKVGKSFPVFLHPKTKEEYALARQEIKTGTTHKDFKFIFTPETTLEEDSIRRDFTCNALYQDLITGEIIDYHNGKDDIKNKILRHISSHFAEDPLRVLRMCRFAAELEFAIAPETMELAQKMVKNGELKHLSKDRIWQEFEKALSSKAFYRFIETARECGALKEILPEVEQLFLVPEREDYHPEKNSGAHTLLALKAAATTDAMVNFAVLCHDIGKIKTDPACWPSHRGHDKLGEDVIKEMAKRLKVPNEYKDFAIFTAVYHMVYHQKIKQSQKKLAHIAIYLSRWQHKDYYTRFVAALRADMNGRARDVPPKEISDFEEFSRYLACLTDGASQNKPSVLPSFENMIEKIKDGSLPPAALNEAYIEFLLKKYPCRK